MSEVSSGLSLDIQGYNSRSLVIGVHHHHNSTLLQSNEKTSQVCWTSLHRPLVLSCVSWTRLKRMALNHTPKVKNALWQLLRWLKIYVCSLCDPADSTVNVRELQDKVWTSISLSVQEVNIISMTKREFLHLMHKLQWNICIENKLTIFIWDPLHNYNSSLITYIVTIKGPKHHFLSGEMFRSGVVVWYHCMRVN